MVTASPSKFDICAVQTAAAFGKHIFCEKPLAVTIEDVDAAIAAAEKAKVLLEVGFMRAIPPGLCGCQSPDRSRRERLFPRYRTNYFSVRGSNRGISDFR